MWRRPGTARGGAGGGRVRRTSVERPARRRPLAYPVGPHLTRAGPGADEERMPAPSVGGQPGVVVATRDERNLRTLTAIAMWLGGGMAVGVAALLSSGAERHAGALALVTGWCVIAALFSFLVFPRVSNGTLYVLNNTFSTLGALTVAVACVWSGGASSGLMELYFFPVLYDAYFFRAREVGWHLALNSMLAAAPLLYSDSVVRAQFPGHALALVVAFWSMSIVIWRHRQRMLRAEAAARRQALSDPLTGLHNLRGLHESAARLADGGSLFVIDLDEFKGVNSRHGHVGADRLLRAVADGLLQATRKG